MNTDENQKKQSLPTDKASASEPSAASADSQSKQPAGKPKFTKKQIIVTSVVAAILLLVATPLAVYGLWYNKPEKVVQDALGSMLSLREMEARGSMVSRSGQAQDPTTMNFALTSTGGDAWKLDAGVSTKGEDGKTTTIDGSFVGSGSTVYVKINNLKSNLQQMAGQDYDEFDKTFGGIIAKLDSKWLSIADSDIEALRKEFGLTESGDTKELTCVQGAYKNFLNSKLQQQQVIKAYKDNRFIIVKETKPNEVIDGRDSNHYVVGGDQKKLESFATALIDTDAFRAMDGCVSEDLGKTMKEDLVATYPIDQSTTVDLWVDRWNHQPTKIKMQEKDSSGSETTMESTLKLGSKVPKIDAPKSDVTLTQIVADIKKATEQFYTIPSLEAGSDPMDSRWGETYQLEDPEYFGY